MAPLLHPVRVPLLLVVLGLAASGVTLACDADSEMYDESGVAALDENGEEEASGTEVSLAVAGEDVVDVARRRVEVRVPVVGSFEPLRRAQVATDEGGVVRRFGPSGRAEDEAEEPGKLAVGTFLEKGAVLVELENRMLRQQHARLEGQLESLRFSLFGEGSRARPEEDAELRVARRLARIEYDRQRELARERAVPQARLEQAEQAYAQARAAYEGALKQLDALEAEHELLSERVAQLHVRAPFAGRVAEVHVELGEHVPAGGAVVTLLDDTQLDYVFTVPERYGPHVRVGESTVMPELAAVRLDPLTVSELAPQVKRGERSLTVRARLTNPARDAGNPSEAGPRAISAGRFTQARLWLDVPGLFVPAEAVRLRDGQSTLFVVDRDDRVETRTIRRGIQGEGYVQVLTNLQTGERVLTRQLTGLQAGTHLRIQEENGEANRSGQPVATQ